MYDFRTEIISLAEKTLHSFVSFRLQDMGIADTWKIGLRDFVVNEERFGTYPVRSCEPRKRE